MSFWHDVGFQCARVSAQRKHDETSEIDRSISIITIITIIIIVITITIIVTIIIISTIIIIIIIFDRTNPSKPLCAGPDPGQGR